MFASFAIAIPLPFTNAIPALGITIMNLGLLNRDGLTIIIGFFVAIIGTMIAFLATIFGLAMVKFIFNIIKDLIF